MNLIEKLVDKINTKHSSTVNFYAFDPVGHSKFYLSALEWVLTQIDTLKNDHNNGWISVDDELPRQSGYYLVYGFDNFDEQCYAKIQHFSMEVNGFFATDLDFEVEYWQPLPEPPKE